MIGAGQAGAAGERYRGDGRCFERTKWWLADFALEARALGCGGGGKPFHPGGAPAAGGQLSCLWTGPAGAADYSAAWAKRGRSSLNTRTALSCRIFCRPSADNPSMALK
jgi:hypothetical protein